MYWLWWVAAAILFALIEVVTLTFVLLMLAGGALVAAVVAAYDTPFWVQVLVFAAVSVILLLTVRRTLWHRFRERTPKTLTNADALVGREAVSVVAVTQTDGRVKLTGEVWSARVPAGAPVVPAGERVRVVRIEGAIAVVEPLAVGI